MALTNCPNCGRLVSDTFTTCPGCQAPLEAVEAPQQQNDPKQTIYVNIPDYASNNNSNGMGIAGFVLALISLFIGYIPIFGWIIWLLGAIFSIVGMFKEPRGFAIAGFVISFIDIILIILLGAAIYTFFAGLLGLGFLAA